MALCQKYRKNIELPKKFWLDLIQGLYDRVESICITGGEPLLYDGIKDVLQKSIENIRDVNIISNGEMLNDDLVDFFKKITRKISFHLSMDGNIDTHDSIRKVSGSYKRISYFSNEMSTNEKCFIRVNSVIRNENINNLIDMIEGIKGWARFITLQHQYFIFDDYDYNKETSLFGSIKSSAKYFPINPLTNESITKLKELMKIINEKYSGYVSFVPKLNIDQIDEYYLNSSTKPLHKQCPNLYNTMRIKSDGSVMTCGWIYNKIGDITKDTLENIWDSDEINRCRDIINTDNMDICKRCCGIWN
jgi:molybdenum cofactor biosynthesis enzyme MoaA